MTVATIAKYLIPATVCGAAARLAQDKAPLPQPDTTAGARVERMLKRLLALDSVGARTAYWRPTAKRPTKTWLETVTEGALTCWSLQDGRRVLATSGARWVQKDQDGEWTPCRRPTGTWESAYLPDARFLAERLLALPDARWSVVSEIAEDRVVRAYTAKLDKQQSLLLLRSGALTSQGAGAGNRIVFLAGGGGGGGWAARTIEASGHFEIRIHWDPKTGLPTRIVADLFGKNAAAGAGRILVAGGGAFRVQEKEKEEEEEKGEKDRKKKTKASLRIQIDVRDAGTAKATAVDAEARRLLVK